MQNAHDPGLDGYIPASGTQSNQWFGRDAAAVELGYYKSNAASTFEDYTAIGNNGHISGKTGSNFGESTASLYNGNIGSMVTTLPDKTQLSTNNVVQASSRGAVYQYDQLNRIRESWSFTNTDVPNYQWDNNLMPGAIPQEWLTQYTYDAMGNIETLRRQGGTGATDMDQLTYNYDYGTPTWKNQLLHVDDSKAAGLHTEDIDDQAANNYTYDEIGNLIADVAEEIQTIEWTVYGKIKKITRTGASNTKRDLEFEYNAAGQRVKKRTIPVGVFPYLDDNWYDTVTTYYMRDASGNIMATYKHYYKMLAPDLNIMEERLVVEEWDLYGSNRLGTLNKETIVASRLGALNSGGLFEPGIPDTYTLAGPLDFELSDEQVGYKYYELTNHLGNVLATITDRKVPFVNGSSYDYFNAQVVSMTDYYPFGMQIEERSWVASSGYRFGFNGKENDNEVKGTGNQQDYGMRIYDTRLGKFLSVDPLTKEYPWNSTYSFAENCPIAGVDLDGKELWLLNSVANKYLPNIFAKENQAVLKQSFGISPGSTTGKVFDFGMGAFRSASNAQNAFTTVNTMTSMFISYGQNLNNFAQNPTTGNASTIIPPWTGAGFIASGVDAGKEAANGNWGPAGEFTMNTALLFTLSKVPNEGAITKSTTATKAVFDQAKLTARHASAGESPIGILEYKYDGEHVGTAYRSADHGTSLDLHIPEKFQDIGIGAEIFKREVAGVNRFTAEWIKSSNYATGKSVNLARYEAGIAKGLTKEDAAWGTWSGQQAKKNGFTKVTVYEHPDSPGGIEAVFEK